MRLGGEGDTTPPLSQIHSMEDWMHILHTHSHEGFPEIDPPDHSPCETRCPTRSTPSQRSPIGEIYRNHGRHL